MNQCRNISLLFVIFMTLVLSCNHPKQQASYKRSYFTTALRLNDKIAYEDGYRHTVAELGKPDNMLSRVAVGQELSIKGAVFYYSDHYTIILKSVDFEHHPANYIRVDNVLLNNNVTVDAIRVFEPEEHDEDLFGNEAKDYRVCWIPVSTPRAADYWLLFFNRTTGRLCKMLDRSYD